MPGFSATLDTAIGLVFVFLLLSLLATWVQEVLTMIAGWRSKNLVNMIQYLFQPSTEKPEGLRKLEEKWSEGVEENVAEKLEKNAVKAFYEHPIIKGLARPKKLPSYISSRDFGITLLDLLTKAGTADPTQPELTLANLEEGIKKLESKMTREALLAIVRNAKATEHKIEEKIVSFRKGVEVWFDATMDRATGWYKRKAQWVALGIGILLAIAFNADAIGLAQALWRDSGLRDTVSATAVAYIVRGQTEDEIKAKKAQNQLEKLGLPIGWSHQNLASTLGGWLLKILGWLLTGFAISQGSQIWFDLLTRLVNIRGTGKKPGPVVEGGG